MLGNWFLLEHISDAKEESSLPSLRPSPFGTKLVKETKLVGKWEKQF